MKKNTVTIKNMLTKTQSEVEIKNI